MIWKRCIDELPVIPEGKYGVSVLVAQFDPCYDEINPGRGYSINKYTSYGKGTLHDEGIVWFYEMLNDGEFVLCCDPVTHWAYLPEPPEYDPEVLNPILQHYHDTARPQSPLKQIPQEPKCEHEWFTTTLNMVKGQLCTKCDKFSVQIQY